jgi:hypothetical protein
MKKRISKLALLCYLISIILFLILLGFSYFTQLVSHGTVLINMWDLAKDFVRHHEERILLFEFPLYGLLFQWRYNKLRKAEGEKVRELYFSKKEKKISGITLCSILVLYPLLVFIMLLFQTGLSKIPYSYVGTINEVKDHFPPYNWLLVSSPVLEEEVTYRIKLSPDSSLDQDDLSNDIFPIFDELNLYGSIGKYTDSHKVLPDGEFEIGVNAAIRGNHVKEIVFEFFEKELEKLPYILSFERLNQ